MGKFVRCSVASCAGGCCRGGGVCLEEEDIARVRWALRNVAGIGDDVTEWLGDIDGEKVLQTKDGSECLFLDADGCRLEKAAVALHMDRWALKPLACWLFPMWEGADGSLNFPPEPGSAPEQFGVNEADRRMRADFYSSMPCGRETGCGGPAEETFAPEISRWSGEAGRRSVRTWLTETKCRIGAGSGAVGVFALVAMNAGEDPAPSVGRAKEMVRIDAVDVSDEMGAGNAAKHTMDGYAVSRPDGSRWARPMAAGLVDIAFFVREGALQEANVEWDWEKVELRLTRDVQIGEELRLHPAW